jgi:uroporphyrinogen-III synthase
MHQTLYISRELEAGNHLHKALSEKGFEIIASPMIRTESVPFEPKTFRSGWIFFSSKQAVSHFFAEKPETGKCELAAIGEGTARHLARYGEVAFTGHVAETEIVAKEFKKVAGRKKVYFPVSDQSVRTVQQALPASQVVDIVCYRTIESPVPVGSPDILVFSSPSNVKAYLKANKILATQKTIAFGKTTGTALRENGVASIVISKGTSDKALLDAINEALTS